MYFNHLKTPKKPTRIWARKTPTYITNHFLTAFKDNDFVDRDYLDEEIVKIHFIPTNGKDVIQDNHNIIAWVSNAFETVCIWEDILPYGNVKPIHTFIIIGYEQDVLKTYSVLHYLINGTNNLLSNLIEEYRRKKINQRRRSQNNGTKIINNLPDARKLASSYINNLRIKISDSLSYVPIRYSVLHNNKTDNINTHILATKKLNFKNYSDTKIQHAYCSPGKRILNRIIK